MVRSITIGGRPMLSPCLNPMPSVTISVRPVSAARKTFSTSQAAYRVKIYMAWIVRAGGMWVNVNWNDEARMTNDERMTKLE